MRYCGNCGAELHERELAMGVCPVCYTRITAEGNVRDVPITNSAALTIPDAAPNSPSATLQRISGRLPIPAATRSPRALRVFAVIGSMMAILLVFITVLVLVNAPPAGSDRTLGGGSSNQQTNTATTNPIKKTPHPGQGTATSVVATASVNVTLTPSASTTATITPTPTMTPTPTNTPTPTPVPADLVVTPTTQTAFSTLQCISTNGVNVSFTVMNNGAVAMDWTVTSTLYTPNNSGGTLNGQQQANVNFTHIHNTFTATFTANAQNSPQAIKVICGGS